MISVHHHYTDWTQTVR